jgi:hypothetical protein
MTPPILTHHAVARYAERYAPWLSFEEAHAALALAASTAIPLRERTKYGDEQWAISEPVARLVVKREGPVVTVVTIFCEEWYRSGVKPGRVAKGVRKARRERERALWQRRPSRFSRATAAGWS